MVSCDCSCDEGDAADVYEAVMRKARKPHCCCECGEVIEPGQRYEFASICYDGGWGHAKTCQLCVRIRDDLCPNGFCHGELRQVIWDCLDFVYLTGEEKPPWRPFGRQHEQATQTVAGPVTMYGAEGP